MSKTGIQSILNKLTIKSYRRLDEELLKPTKKEIEEEVLKSVDNPEFRKKFEQFYQKIEVGGRKHFFIKEFDSSDEIDIKKNIEIIKEKYNKRSWDLLSELNNLKGRNSIIFWYEKDGGIFYLQKNIIKEIKEKIDEKENENEIIVRYKKIRLHHVTFIRIDLMKKLIVVGTDTYQKLFKTPKEIKEWCYNTWEEFFEPGLYFLKNAITSNDIYKIIREDNSVVVRLKGSISIDEGQFDKKTKDIKRIIKDINEGKYKLDEVKKNNSNIDIITHPMLEDVKVKHEDKLNYKKAELYWFTDVSGEVNGFKVSISAEDSAIITYESHIYEKEILNVIERIIQLREL